MTRVRVLIVMVVGAATALPAAADDASLEAMQKQLAEQAQRLDKAMERIESVEKENAQLRAARHRDWLDERRTEQVKALIHQTMADASTRGDSFDDRMHAGYRNCFFLACPDGRFLLQFLGQLQLRYMHSHADEATGGDTDRGGFEVSRFRLGLKGHAHDPSWQYFVLTGYTPSGGSIFLDSYVRKHFDERLSLTAGQYKTPLLQEFLVSTKRLPFVTRSYMGARLSGTYTQGVMLRYNLPKLHTYLSVDDGVDARNEMAIDEATEGVGVTARAEWLLTGDWKQYRDFQSWPGGEPLIVLAGGYHYEQGEYGTTTDELTIHRWALDGTWKLGNGLALYGAAVGNHVRGGDMLPTQDQYALLIQGGAFITDDIELVGRYEWSDMDVDGVAQLSALTGGCNLFLAKHKLKWTTEVSYALNPLTQATVGGRTYGFAIGGFGWRSQQADADGQVVIRSQLQYLF
jgi:hypothetical protein